MFYQEQGYHIYYVYIITNKFRSTFYIGMTNNLRIRLQQHNDNIELAKKTFASTYNLKFLVYYEKFTWVNEAIAREKELKKIETRKKIRIDSFIQSRI